MKRRKFKNENTIIYTSSADGYYKLVKHHPIKFIERTYGIKLSLYQNILLLSINFKEKRKKNKIEKVIGKFLRK